MLWIVTNDKPFAGQGAFGSSLVECVWGGRGLRLGTGVMESNARYYARRAVEERMKAQRAITEQARAWHAKLAHDFAERATACTADAPTALSA